MMAAAPASAFCVYNKTSVDILFVQQVDAKQFFKFNGFYKLAKAGQNACCNWQNKDCNPAGKRDSAVKMLTELHPEVGIAQCGVGKSIAGVVDTENPNVPVQAGGWIRVEANPSYNRGRAYSKANPIAFARAYSYDGKLQQTAYCPGK